MKGTLFMLKDDYLDRIADALEKRYEVDPKLIGGGVLKPNIYRIADALDPNPVLLKDGTIKNPLARIADALETMSPGAVIPSDGSDSENLGGRSSIFLGDNAPDSDLGSDGDMYIKYDHSLAYLRTSESLDMTFSNYTYNTGDYIIFKYRNAGSHSGTWPVIFWSEDKSAFYLRYDLQYGRTNVEITLNSVTGTYDAGSSFVSGTELLNIIDINANNIVIYLGEDEITHGTLQVSTDVETNQSLVLLPTNNIFKPNIDFVSFEVYRNNVLIHDYVPVSNGILDAVNDRLFKIPAGTVTYSTVESERLDKTSHVFLKNNGIWKDLLSVQLSTLDLE